MADDDLVRMANQIADFFAAWPEDEAAARVADHIEKFWAPSMRRGLAALMAGPRADDLAPLARKGAELSLKQQQTQQQ